MNLKHLSNQALHLQTVSLAGKERLTLIEILWHLRENERRMLYAEKGHKDLKEYCIKEMKYSEGSAWRRISAMRLLRDIPEIETKIQTGSLNLTQINLAQTAFRELKPSKLEKQEILNTLENQTTRGTQRILAESQPDLFQKPEVVEKPLKGKRLEVTLILDEELQKELEEIELLLGKKYSKLELLKLMAKEKLSKLRQKQEKLSKLRQDKIKTQLCDDKRKAQPARSKAATISRNISRITLRELDKRDDHRCQYRDPISGRHCEARHYLQTEHIIPFSKNGSHEITNLQRLCANHNRLRAVQQFGVEKMKKYIPSLR